MKRQVIGVLAGVLGATALIAAQGSAAQQTSAQPQTQKAAAGSDITVTGCLTQGSSPAVFILSNARQRPDDKTEKGTNYVVVAASEDLPFAANLNHEVSVTGSPDKAGASSGMSSSSSASGSAAASASAGQKSEKDLQRFSAKTVTLVADRCTAQPKTK